MLDFISTVYSYFGMDFALKLSTRPENALGDKVFIPLPSLSPLTSPLLSPLHALGDKATWDKAEAYMAEALDEFKEKTGRDWSLNEGDGAFYGCFHPPHPRPFGCFYPPRGCLRPPPLTLLSAGRRSTCRSSTRSSGRTSARPCRRRKAHSGPGRPAFPDFPIGLG